MAAGFGTKPTEAAGIRSHFTHKADSDRDYIFVGCLCTQFSLKTITEMNMRLDPNNPRQPRPDETGPMKKKEGERNLPGSNPEREEEGGYVEEER